MAGHIGGAPVVEWELELPDDFWDQVDIIGDPKTACWIWTGVHWPKGYGRWNQHNWGYQAHRVVFGYYLGVIPDDKYIDHLCMNKTCVNPYHLELVSPAENTRRWAEQTITHCPQGHPYNWVNTQKGKTRRCLICKRESDRKYQEKIARTKRTDSMQRRKGRKQNISTRLGYMIDRSGLLGYEVGAIVGINPHMLSKYTNGKVTIPPHHAQRLADLFGVKPEDVIGIRQSSGPSGGRTPARRGAGPLGGTDPQLRRAPRRQSEQGSSPQDHQQPAVPVSRRASQRTRIPSDAGLGDGTTRT